MDASTGNSLGLKGLERLCPAGETVSSYFNHVHEHGMKGCQRKPDLA